jgi:hypothetical protein
VAGTVGVVAAAEAGIAVVAVAEAGRTVVFGGHLIARIGLVQSIGFAVEAFGFGAVVATAEVEVSGIVIAVGIVGSAVGLVIEAVIGNAVVAVLEHSGTAAARGMGLIVDVEAVW